MIKKSILLIFAFYILLGSSLSVFAEEISPSGIPLSGLESLADDYAKDIIGKSAAGASLIVVKDNQVILSKGYGYADIENQIVVDAENTVFEWGSISKLLVWVAVMQQAEQGKIDLQADIRDYLPEGFLTKLTYETPITMLHLMNHNAGFEENIFDLLYTSPDKVRSLEEGLKLAEPAQIYEPGTVVAYSNYSTALAGYIVERVTGQPFYKYINEHIFKTLGMNHSSIHPLFEDNPSLTSNKAQAYALMEEGRFAPSSWNYMSMYPCGGANGTAGDLAAFAMALMPQEGERSPLFQQQDTLQQMFTRSYSPDENMLDIAHGFWEYPGAKRGLTHGGNTIAFSSNFHIVPEENFAVIVLTNQMGEIDLCYGLTKALVEGDIPVIPMEGSGPDGSVLEGTYIPARKSENSALKVYAYIFPLKVREIEENTIQISMAGETADYIQTAPYVYRKAAGSTLFDIFPQMHFRVENGQVMQVSTVISDYLPLSPGRTKPFMVIYAAAALLCAGYFVVMLPVLLIQWFLRLTGKRKTAEGIFTGKGRGYLYLFNLTGAGFLGNCFALIFRLLMNSNRSYGEVKIHFLINFALTGLSIVTMLVWGVRRKTLNLTVEQRRMTILSIGMLLILIALLVSWNFYS